MFDVGFAELFLLSLIGLLVLGPERLPRVARTIGGFVRKARASWTSLRRTIEMELAEADISEPIKKAKQEFKQIGKDLTDIPGFATESVQSIKPDPSSEAATDQETDPSSEAATDQETDAKTDSGNSKDDNA